MVRSASPSRSEGNSYTMKTIEITISPTGATTAETKGFEGSSCRQASEFLTKTLGRQTSEQLTSEFYSYQHASQDAQERT